MGQLISDGVNQQYKCSTCGFLQAMIGMVLGKHLLLKLAKIIIHYNPN